jgi:hypothetical protein
MTPASPKLDGADELFRALTLHARRRSDSNCSTKIGGLVVLMQMHGSPPAVSVAISVKRISPAW